MHYNDFGLTAPQASSHLRHKEQADYKPVRVAVVARAGRTFSRTS